MLLYVPLVAARCSSSCCSYGSTYPSCPRKSTLRLSSLRLVWSRDVPAGEDDEEGGGPSGSARRSMDVGRRSLDKGSGRRSIDNPRGSLETGGKKGRQEDDDASSVASSMD